LQDVVDMVGLFIDEGPVVQVKSRAGDPYVLEDKNPAIQFEGELVVLVNNFSASASEIFAAAIQDYGRGIVMGSSSTYGKGTVQRFFELDRYSRNPDLSPLGSLKITTQKYYRINGGTTQLKGVESDIVFPDNYAYIDIGEKELDFAMPWTEIEPVSYNNSYKDELPDLGNVSIDSDTFKQIDEFAKAFKERRDRSLHSLNFDDYLSYKRETNEITDKYKELTSADIDGMMVESLQIDAVAIADDEDKLERTQDWFDKLKQDVYLKEAIEVLSSVN